MAEQKNYPQKIASLVFGCLIAISFFIIIFQNQDPDLGWHLKVGEEILESGSVPHYDHFSHTMPGHEWIAHSWLADAGLEARKGIVHQRAI